ncbi:hypothetical protein NM208_g15937 [Fusarium decemcellulare]|uniref:Uncharacterized protein n=1 Tax=Fusarium decemcellulare TaxID=57161 RepID=A0ACC1REA1_9HYPO|nr:hypothetical protein NM208_g15937 [Fusarium decemcellulare]
MSASGDNTPSSQDLLRAVSSALHQRAGKDVFAIGGTISNPESSTSTPSDNCPLSIRWDRHEKGQCRKLTLPVDDDAASKESFELLLKDCQPATFGVGSQEVLDEEYRKAGKMDKTGFSTSFNPYEHGIVDTINQVLAQGNTNALGVKAELYKLNVYSSPSGKFKPHVDTPRSDSQMGSLVVCLQVPHQGGQLAVRHGGREIVFDWASQSTNTVQWAAFFSDCEHEVLEVTEGHRMTLTYNLFWTTYGPASMAAHLPALDQESLHFYNALEKLLESEDFLSSGGLVGFTCTHAYPHTSKSSVETLHHSLKGLDMVVYQALKRILGSARVSAVLDDAEWREDQRDWRSDGDDEDDGCVHVSDAPSPALPGKTGLARTRDCALIKSATQTPKELAVAFNTYGNSPGIDAYYTSAVVIAQVNEFLPSG